MSESTTVYTGYFYWLIDLVGMNRKEYYELLYFLYHRNYEWFIPLDENRAQDGFDLRLKFAESQGMDYRLVLNELPADCTVLEMMCALAKRCEDQIMTNIDYGDRTSVWFMDMIKSLGVDIYTDSNFDEEKVDYCICRFLNRDYEPDGKGGLFTVKNPPRDMRNVEIWCQLNWYLSSILGI